MDISKIDKNFALKKIEKATNGRELKKILDNLNPNKKSRRKKFQRLFTYTIIPLKPHKCYVLAIFLVP
mgnify:CR=1 FL=1